MNAIIYPTSFLKLIKILDDKKTPQKHHRIKSEKLGS